MLYIQCEKQPKYETKEIFASQENKHGDGNGNSESNNEMVMMMMMSGKDWTAIVMKCGEVQRTVVVITSLEKV